MWCCYSICTVEARNLASMVQSQFNQALSLHEYDPMRASLCQKIIAVCDEKIAKKGESVGLSFYAFFANKNDDPELLMEAATWWITTRKLDHFEKATKIKAMILAGQ